MGPFHQQGIHFFKRTATRYPTGYPMLKDEIPPSGNAIVSWLIEKLRLAANRRVRPVFIVPHRMQARSLSTQVVELRSSVTIEQWPCPLVSDQQ